MEPRKKYPMLDRVYQHDRYIGDVPLLPREETIDRQHYESLKGTTAKTRTLDKLINNDNVYIDAGTLPEVVIRPPKDNAVYKANYMIPDKALRNQFYNSINEDYDQRLYINRLYNLYNKAQKPTIKSTRSKLNIQIPFLQKIGIVEGDRDRANYNALFNTMFVSPDDTASEIEAELAHAYQYYGTDVPRKWGVLNKLESLPGDIKIKGKSGYKRFGNQEFNAHSIIEPMFNTYLTNKDIYYSDIKSMIDDMYDPKNRDFYFHEIKPGGPKAGMIKTFDAF